ncbi:MAG: hypothetical protein LBQ62_06165 [Candidatus Accumulibacter sp.]|jgi:hypothetical protein|nr:hypothetical protein [Accumulibacter sp.]
MDWPKFIEMARFFSNKYMGWQSRKIHINAGQRNGGEMSHRSRKNIGIVHPGVKHGRVAAFGAFSPEGRMTG